MNTPTLERTLLEAPIADMELILQKRKELQSEVQQRINAWVGNHNGDGAKPYHNSPNGKNGSGGMSQAHRNAISRGMRRLAKAKRGNKGAEATTNVA